MENKSKKLKIKFLLIIIYISLLVIAIFTRMSFSDNYNDESKRKELFTVPYLGEELEEICSIQYKKLIKSPIVITGRATGKSQYVTGNFWQEAEVVQVLKGKSVKTGEKIKIVGTGNVSPHEDDIYVEGKTYINTSFLNYMKKDNLYLIFLSHKVNSSDTDINSEEAVYCVNTDAITMQYLDLTEERYNVLDQENIDGKSYETEYSKVSDSEFSTNSQEIMKSLIKQKKFLIKKFLGKKNISGQNIGHSWTY